MGDVSGERASLGTWRRCSTGVPIAHVLLLLSKCQHDPVRSTATKGGMETAEKLEPLPGYGCVSLLLGVSSEKDKNQQVSPFLEATSDHSRPICYLAQTWVTLPCRYH